MRRNRENQDVNVKSLVEIDETFKGNVKTKKKENTKETSNDKEISNDKELLQCICSNISEDIFDLPDTMDKILLYAKNHKRILYSEISNYIFELDTKKTGNVNSNVILIYNEINNNAYTQKQRDIALKIYDHIVLVELQRRNITTDKDKIVKYSNEGIARAQQVFQKENTNQMISLIALFTAMAFLTFGGINSLDNIFLGAKDIPVIQLSIIGSIWCLCIFNLIFLFFYFTEKLNIKRISERRIKYPLMWSGNLIFLSILIINYWIYFIVNSKFWPEIEKMINRNYKSIIWIGTIAIILAISVSIFVIVKMYHKYCKDYDSIY